MQIKMFPDVLVRSSVMVNSGMWVRPLWWEALKAVPPKTVTASNVLLFLVVSSIECVAV